VAKWKLFKRSKTHDESNTEKKTTTIYLNTSEKKPSAQIPPQKSKPVTEYNETLFSRDTPTKKEKKPGEEIREPVKRTSWENPKTIERNIDTMNKTRPQPYRGYSKEDVDLDKKIDQILSKKKMKL
jgi:hypothetical protein